MRALSVLLIALALLAPSAHAAAFELESDRIVEGPLVPGEPTAFRIDARVHADGALYAKLLPTSGNAVHDGRMPNGSSEEETGWFVAFALERADGERTELGAFSDSRGSALAPVAAGEGVTLVATVHAPGDALAGGSLQKVFVALAHRGAAMQTGGGSGAYLDEARAVTLVLRAPATDVVAPTPDDSSANDEPLPDATGEDGAGRTPAPGPGSQASAPEWFWSATLILLGSIVLLLAGVLVMLRRIWLAQAATQAHAAPTDSTIRLEEAPFALPLEADAPTPEPRRRA